MDSDPGCDIICDPKSHTADIFCQTVWILLKDTIYRLSVFLVYLRSQIQRNPIFLQKDHGTAHIRLFCHLFRNLHGFLYGFLAAFLKIGTDQLFIRSKICLFKLYIFPQQKCCQKNAYCNFSIEIHFFPQKICQRRHAQCSAQNKRNIDAVDLGHSHGNQ